MSSCIPDVTPPLFKENPYRADVPISAAREWLRLGWRDLWQSPGISLFYGALVFGVSALMVGCLFGLGWDFILFPALSGCIVIGPALAVGLYEKSRRIAVGAPLRFGEVLLVKPKAGTQVAFIGAILCSLMLVWMRAAVILYALFFGLAPFPGSSEIATTLFITPMGWALLIVGTLVGGLFAAFSFAISAFSIPMLLNEEVDAFTAMGTSMALVCNNLPVMLVWGVVVLGLLLLCLATAFIGSILVFPLIGHASWHAYVAIRRPR